MDGQFLAQIQQVAFNFAPKGWATCAAQLMSIQQNAALFSILGTTYGGNGIQTFGLPDLRGRVANHWGQGPGLQDYVLGEVSGTTSTTMLASNLPLHIHTLMANNQAPNAVAPNSAALAAGGAIGANTALQYGPTAGSTMSPGEIAPNGSSQPFSIMQPYNTLQYCIALQGIFPSRN
jgi:microcystin-dependent protein